MTTIGVSLSGGVMIWVEAGGHPPQPPTRVLVRLDGDESEGTVLVGADQWIGPAPEGAGVLLEICSLSTDNDDTTLPLADMPPLGTSAHAEGITGTITALQPLQQTVTITGDTDSATIPARVVEVDEVSQSPTVGNNEPLPP